MTAADLYNKLITSISFERLFLLIFFIGLLLRLYHLDLKLFHHDEAVHAWFAYNLLATGSYQYDPVYHGPLLYYVTASMFGIFGSSDLVGRIVPALLGSLLVLLIYPIHQLGYLNKSQTLIAALFIAVSPSMIYFSRFLRNDIFIAFFTLLLLVAILLYLERGHRKYAVLAAVALGAGMSSKENMPIIVLIFGSYLIYLLWSKKVHLPVRWKEDALLGMLITVGIMALFYSSFGQHPEVLTTGAFDAIIHWTSMHQQERLGGPPYFYLLLFLLYEVPILVFALIGTGQFLTGRVRPAPGDADEDAVIVNKNHEFARFCIVWMVLSIGIYAYIGEKVPWLILHQLLPMIFVAVYGLTWRRAGIAALFSVLLIAMSVHVAFIPADINEPIVQVQNSEELRDVMTLIDASDRAAVASDTVWPLPWYYRGEGAHKLTYFGSDADAEFFEQGDYDLVITHDMRSFPELDGFTKETYRHSYWFSFYEIRDRWLHYYFLRDGSGGSLNWDVFSRVKTG